MPDTYTPAILTEHVQADTGGVTQRDWMVLGALLTVYLVLIAIGPAWFRSDGVMVEGQELSYDRASFLTINAATLSGFQQTIGIEEFNHESMGGPVMALALVVVGILFNSIAGGIAVSRILRLPYSAGRIAVASISALLLATCLGAALTVNASTSLFDSFFQSASAFGNCGLSTGHLGGAMEIRSHLLLLSAFAGSLSVPVLLQIYDWLCGRIDRICAHGRVAIASAMGVYVIGLVALVLVQWPGLHQHWSVWRSLIASCSVMAMNTRTAGLHIDLPIVMPKATQWIIMVLMMIGASPGGTGGGIKSVTLVELGRGAYAALRGRPVQRGFGIAVIWVSAYLLLIVGGLVAISCIEAELPGDRLNFLVISALSNVGLSHDPVSMVWHSLRALSVILLVGRLAPLAVLWWMAATVKDADLAIG